MDEPPDLDAVRRAHGRIRSHVHRTPVLTCRAIDDVVGAKLFFKCENFQKVGAFKIRGATNAVLSLDETAASRGVATHSSGNHAQALALAGRVRGIPVHVVMPENAPAVKRSAVAGYGAHITLCQPTQDAREAAAERVVAQTGATLIHAYNDHRVIAGQGTVALEFLEEVSDLDVLIAPVGGGGLLSGTAIVAKSIRAALQVVGAEPANADDACRSLQAGRILPAGSPQTIADGLRTSLGDKTFAILRQFVDGIALAPESAIIDAMRLIFERMKIVVEPSSAVPLAILLAHARDYIGRNIGIILSGGNVDVAHLPFHPTRPPL